MDAPDKLSGKLIGYTDYNFDDVKVFRSQKHADKTGDEYGPRDFRSFQFYTSPHDYLKYLRLFLYGCDIG